jgi:4-amino-4-deoxy-L-arabinose transferase-like glycosyltransferase
MISPVVALIAWVLGILMAVIGGWKAVSHRLQPSWKAVAGLALLIIFAFAIRGLGTAHIPIFLTGDEGSSGISAMQFLKGEIDNIFIVGWYSFPSLYFSIQAAFIAIFGETTQALRILSACVGTLTVVAVYFAGRAMFGNRTGALAALALAVLHFHIHFSRIGLNNIWDGLWYTVTVGALWYGWEKENRNAFLLAGIGLGIAQYFYTSSRTLIPLVILWVLIAGLFDRSHFKRALPDILIMALVAIAVVIPLACFFFRSPNEFLAPMQRVSVFGAWLEYQVQLTGQPAWKILLEQIGLGFQAFVYTPLNAWYTPGVPILRPFAAGLFLLGLALLILRGRDSRMLLLVLWLIAFGFLGGLSESTPAAQRYVAAAPLCALLVGYGLSESISLLEKLWPKLSKIFLLLTIVLVAILAMDDLRFYFLEYTSLRRIVDARNNGMIAQHLADTLQTEQDDLQVVFFGQPAMGFYSIPSLQYLAPHIQGIDMIQPWPSSENPTPTSSRLLFVFLPNNETEILPVESDYPGGKLFKEIAADGEVLYRRGRCRGSCGNRLPSPFGSSIGGEVRRPRRHQLQPRLRNLRLLHGRTG